MLSICIIFVICILIQCNSAFNSVNSKIGFTRKDASVLLKETASMRYSSKNCQLNMAAGEFNWKQIKKGGEDKMSKCLDSVQTQFGTLRASGANPTMLDRVTVDYFGAVTPLNQLARVAASGSQQLVVEPFDKSALKDIEKAIATSGLNLTPNNDGSGCIRINIPPLTEDRRKELVKQAKVLTEDGKVAVRNVRRDIVDKIKAAEKDKLVGKDDSKGYQDDLQKVTDDIIKKLDNMLKLKEKDLLTI